MVLWVFVYISMSLEKESVVWVVFNLFIPANNEIFYHGTVIAFSCFVESMPLSINFQGLFLTVLFLLNKSGLGLLETVTHKLKGIFLKTVAALSVHLFWVNSVFFPPGEITFL